MDFGLRWIMVLDGLWLEMECALKRSVISDGVWFQTTPPCPEVSAEHHHVCCVLCVVCVCVCVCV
jgi:hypothetical protein